MKRRIFNAVAAVGFALVMLAGLPTFAQNFAPVNECGTNGQYGPGFLSINALEWRDSGGVLHDALCFNPSTKAVVQPGQNMGKADQTALGANVASTPIVSALANPGGTFKVICYVVVTRAATTSSTMPGCSVNFTDADTGVSVTSGVTNSSSGNLVGTTNSSALGPTSNGVIYTQAGSAINYLTTSYATSGATSMQYAIHVKLVYYGP